MVFDIKYYIITITAIFISLGIGIFIGFNMNGQEIFLEQQQQLVNSLENRFNDLRLEKEKLQKTIEELSAENELKEDFIEKAYFEIIDQKLSGFHIAILQTTEHYYYHTIRESLEEAGATVPLHLIFTDKILYLPVAELNNINNFLGVELTKEEVMEKVYADIMNLLVNDDFTSLMSFLIDNQFIELIQYIQYEYPVDQVVIAGGGNVENNQSITVDLNLIEDLHQNNIRVIGVERLDIPHSSIPVYRESGISTVDNIDTLLGRISLVFVAKGRAGSFGEKPYSEELVPLGTP
ncbi:Copper transport outer membrane protein, MctB [Anaerovirgula multivorans]|uniref:Copper transport outer membrane protein, MctB n=1 Tax=Anaerovirgula multivorans TaxID=312168 RepID=A0A238ZVV5_9FIRM|nr:copper transporter [Anaerovirgula multivorans]SNR87028.1 Copper transport outer membrane protein, MctB [Anaerovirgula multivorans]